MDRLVAYLDEMDWQNHFPPGYPMHRMEKRGEWSYQWLFPTPTTAQLCRSRTLNGKLDAEVFFIRTEESGLEVAAALEKGVHPDSPFDRKTGKKIGYL